MDGVDTLLLEQGQGFRLLTGGEVVSNLDKTVQSVVVSWWGPSFDWEAQATIEQLAPG
jgi:hypothetical protein